MCVPLKSLGAASLACLPLLGVVLVCSIYIAGRATMVVLILTLGSTPCHTCGVG